MNWTLEPHLCRSCGGRLLSRPSIRSNDYRCARCGTEAEASSPEAICFCGIRVGSIGRDAGVRCTRNPHPTHNVPDEIIAVALPPG